MFIVQHDMAHSHKQSVSQPVRAGRQAGRGSGFKQTTRADLSSSRALLLQFS